jgi:hypothetical protein
MADRFFSAALGDQLPEHITEGASTSGEAIELRVSDSIYARRLDVIIGIRAILDYLKTKETTPIA